jgi:UDP-N-acetylmuramoylalanine--D-glutamate ligase
MEVNINQDEFFNGYRIYCIRRKHNMKMQQATSVAKLMQIRKATIRESLSSFQGGTPS